MNMVDIDPKWPLQQKDRNKLKNVYGSVNYINNFSLNLLLAGTDIKHILSAEYSARYVV